MKSRKCFWKEVILESSKIFVLLKIVILFLFFLGQPSKFLELFIPRHYRGGRGSTGEPEGRTWAEQVRNKSDRATCCLPSIYFQSEVTIYPAWCGRKGTVQRANEGAHSHSIGWLAKLFVFLAAVHEREGEGKAVPYLFHLPLPEVGPVKVLSELCSFRGRKKGSVISSRT